MFNELRRDMIVRLVDIGRIVDHHCLNLLFIIMIRKYYKHSLIKHIHAYAQYIDSESLYVGRVMGKLIFLRMTKIMFVA
jgi:hypothetical protein